MKHPPLVNPRLLTASAAAQYAGISINTLRKLEIPRRLVRSKPLYDMRDLDAYIDELPYEGEHKGTTKCDEVFGLSD